MSKLTYATPPPSLMRELREVESDAKALDDALAKANNLPGDFPVEQLRELLTGLRALPQGTAEGCRQPLEYARSRLPFVRRKFILTEEQSKLPRDEGELQPPLTRGESIDLKLGALVNSVTTALDEYRALASEQADDAADTAPSMVIDANAPDIQRAIASAKSAEKNLDESIAEVDRIAVPGSETAGNFQRQQRDARGLSRLARIELRMPEFVPRWYRKTVDTLKDYPALMQKTASAMKVGVDVARPMVDAWSELSHKFKHFVLDGVEIAAKALGQAGAALEARRKREIDGLSAPPPDLDLEAAREMILQGRAPLAHWRPWIFDLDFSGKDLSDLAPLAGLASLQTLNLWNTQVSDLSPLAGLASLQSLNLINNQVSDLSPLAGLASLQSLDLRDTQVSDLAPLAGLASLQTLTLWNNQVSDLAPLAGLASLQWLDLRNNQVSDLAPLAGLASLQRLDLRNTQVSDLAPLAGLASLQTLNLWITQVSDLAPLAGLASLHWLNLGDTKVSDVSPLAGLASLQTLDLMNTKVGDLAPLAGLASLKRLDLWGTKVSDLAPLAGLASLQTLDLWGTKVSDLAPLSRLPLGEGIAVESEARARSLSRSWDRACTVKGNELFKGVWLIAPT